MWRMLAAALDRKRLIMRPMASIEHVEPLFTCAGYGHQSASAADLHFYPSLFVNLQHFIDNQ
jgi:hypothetical protein